MLNHDVITKVQTTYTPDGQGGYTQETTELGTFDVQLSVSNNVEEATAYGVSVEEVLKVVSDVPLLDNEAGLYILKGADGIDGKDGTIDFSQLTDEQKKELAALIEYTSPTVDVSKTDGVTTLTITDINGTKTATINDGADGAPGIQGPKGDTGEAGPIGATGPVGPKGDKGDTGATGPAGETGATGPKGDTGATPAITVSATIDNTSNNPTVTVDQTGTAEAPHITFNFKGLKGEKGDAGSGSGSGENGATFTPAIDSDGNLSWTNDKGLANPETVNIKGPKGDTGQNGAAGAKGDTGATPNITINVTSDNESSDTPTATVTKSGTNESPIFAIAFSGLKGAKGDTGATGPAYTLTDADKTAIAQQVLASMTNAEEVSY